MERDMVLLPKTREVYASKILSELTEAPLVTALVLFGRQLIEWPLHLLQVTPDTKIMNGKVKAAQREIATSLQEL